jgi:hypothetical protein
MMVELITELYKEEMPSFSSFQDVTVSLLHYGRDIR